MNDVGPDDIKLAELLVRVSENDIKEVIMATSLMLRVRLPPCILQNC